MGEELPFTHTPHTHHVPAPSSANNPPSLCLVCAQWPCRGRAACALWTCPHACVSVPRGAMGGADLAPPLWRVQAFAEAGCHFTGDRAVAGKGHQAGASFPISGPPGEEGNPGCPGLGPTDCHLPEVRGTRRGPAGVPQSWDRQGASSSPGQATPTRRPRCPVTCQLPPHAPRAVGPGPPGVPGTSPLRSLEREGCRAPRLLWPHCPLF